MIALELGFQMLYGLIVGLFCDVCRSGGLSDGLPMGVEGV